MAEGKFVSYLRVSTDKQGKSGLGLEAQREAVDRYLDGGSWSLLAEYVEVESGKNDDRPKLRQALAHAKRTGATMVIAKLDRLARNVAFVANLMESGVDFLAADNPHANRLTIHILAAVAEDEARRISERTKAALAAVKERIKAGGAVSKSGRPIARLGNPRGAAHLRGLGNDAAVAGARRKAAAVADELRDTVEEIQAAGIVSATGIAAELNRRGILTPSGRPNRKGDVRPGARRWHPTSVGRLLARLGPK